MTSNADATELPAGLLDMIEQDEGRRDTVYIDYGGPSNHWAGVLFRQNADAQGSSGFLVQSDSDSAA